MEIEQLIPLAEITALLPARPTGKRIHRTTIYRWTTVGVCGVRLSYTQVGATRCTTRSALTEFFDSLKTTPFVSLPSKSAAAVRAGQLLDAEENRLKRRTKR